MKHLQELLSKSFIRSSLSIFGDPILLLKRRKVGCRYASIVRSSNKITIKDEITNISDLFDQPKKKMSPISQRLI